jgi:hypothetical protein
MKFDEEVYHQQPKFMLQLAFCFAIVFSGCKKSEVPPSVPEPPKLLVSGLEELPG